MKNYGLLTAVAVGFVISVGGRDFVAWSEPSDLGCRRDVSALTEMHSSLPFPPYLSEDNPVKRGGEFDPNTYFQVLPHLKMRKGFALDYVYHHDGMGGYPILYARPVGQAPYADEAAYRAAADRPDYLEFVIPQDTAQGYFELALLAMMANQFYRDWHANYNDWKAVCGFEGIEEVIQSLESGSPPARPMSNQQKAEARAIQNPSPTVALNEENATVTMVVFTKWGGFYRRTLVINRGDHSIADEQDVPLVDYDCGIAF
jgi:hypothetical protein